MPNTDRTAVGARPPPRLVIAGARGRLGRALDALAVESGMPVVGRMGSAASGANEEGLFHGTAELRRALAHAEVFLSAATPRAEAENLPVVAEERVPAVIATTGLGERTPAWLSAAAGKIPIVLDANFSVGVHLLRRAIRSLQPLPEGFDVSLIETHRRGKRDRPSGTALALARELEPRAAIRRSGRDLPAPTIETVSLRAGETPGVHVVQVAGTEEFLRFEHIAYGRRAFAVGMLAAARWLRSSDPPPPGLYTLEDVLRGVG